jgi:type II secretory pathway pseudopilin PulG/ribosomal protein L40E
MSTPSESGHCDQCGALNATTARFCQQCGARLPWAAPEPAPPSVAAAPPASKPPPAPTPPPFGQGPLTARQALLVVVAVVGFILYVALTSNSPERERQRAQENAALEAGMKQREGEDKKRAAFVIAQQAVEEKLKSPASAQFPTLSESEVVDQGSDTYSILSYVDSQNGFGALIRVKWAAVVQLKGKNDRDEYQGVVLNCVLKE